MAKRKKIDSWRLGKCLYGNGYPASKKEIISYAENTCGDEEVISMLQELPEKKFQNASDLTQVLGGILGSDVNLILERKNRSFF